MAESVLKVGTRGSRLARIQCEHIIDLLSTARPDLRFIIEIVKTDGDLDLTAPLREIGGMGLFTRTIEKKLLAGEIDLAVHSAKDLPAVMTFGLDLGAVPEREDCADVWLSRDGRGWRDISAGKIVGTSSIRRRAQLSYYRRDLNFINIRGNIETRLTKMYQGQCDAMIMAGIGLKRIGRDRDVIETMALDDFLPAPGQGFLAVQIRDDDQNTRAIVREINDQDACRCLTIERLLLAELNAGCSAAIGARAHIENNQLKLKAVVLDPEGTSRLHSKAAIAVHQPDRELITPVVESLLAQGAAELVRDDSHE
jgi:hydroxymethylbilane synthase